MANQDNAEETKADARSRGWAAVTAGPLAVRDCDRPARPFDPAQLDAFIAGIEEIAAFRGMRLSVEEDFDAFARVSRT
ncbi:MAG: hypothetical protein R3316_13125, partial [Rhodovibrionaceae bacterium]|nr:hypothetical protein [Rhodovibrionaceae bacterium]